MKDSLEEFIKQNRQSFDDNQPSEKVWSGIYEAMDFKPSSNTYGWLWRAAAILFFATSVFLYFRTPPPTSNNIIAQKEEITNDFLAVEDYYFHLISEKRQLISDFDGEEISEQSFEQDLQRLDVMYAVLKDELDQNPSKKVVDALILNLLVRIDILNGRLAELDAPEPSGAGEVSI